MSNHGFKGGAGCHGFKLEGVDRRSGEGEDFASVGGGEGEVRGRLVKEEEEEMVYSESWWKVMRGGDLGLM